MHDAVAEQANMAYYGREEALARAAADDVFYAPGRVEVQRLEAMPPGPELVEALVAAQSLVLDTTARIALVGCWERVRSWADAQQLAALSEAAGTPDMESDQWVISDVAMVCGLSERSVSNRFSLMRSVSDNLPATWTALQAGRITSAHLFVMDQVTRDVSAEHAQSVEARVLDKAVDRRWTPGELRAAARRAVLQVDPRGAERRAAKAKRRSDVRYRPEEDMMAALVAVGDAQVTREVYDVVDRRAHALREAGDERGIGELRIEALAQLVLGEGHANRPSGEAIITLDLPTYVALQNNPGDLEGYGPVTAEMARRIAADATLRRLVLEPLSGLPVDLGRRAYRPSAEQQRWIAVRDRTCRFRGCRTRAVRCDIDHGQEFGAGGRTDCDNCGLLCRRHHNFKTRKRWKLKRHPDNNVQWTSPHGFNWWVQAATYDVEPIDESFDFIAHDADPDPPDLDVPLAEAPPPIDDDEIDHDELNRFWQRSLQRAG